jgi:hypothetical protein
MLAYKYPIDNQVFINIILFIIFKNNKISIKPNSKLTGYSDYLIIASCIPDKYYKYSLYNFTDIPKYKELELIVIVKDIVNIIINENSENNSLFSQNIDGFKVLLEKYYMLKFQLQVLLTEKEGSIFLYYQLLKDIDLNNNKKYSNNEINLIKYYSTYEQTCYFIIKNFKNNILVKIPGTKYYSSYFRRDINKLYKISSFNTGYGKTIIETNIPNNYRNNIIFPITIDESMQCKLLIWIPGNIFTLIKSFFKNDKIFPQQKINSQQIIDSYGANGINEYNEIAKKIDIISKYLDII